MSIDNQVVVGMSGHIDHGKTSLVQALTGKNTDSLDQEKLRGMTIDIGFAYLENKVTIIDVPGHEKFVKNMLSGSTGIDIAVLVIAADDGVMPQTKEHFEILKLLNIKNGFVVLNKVDLVENDWIEPYRVFLVEPFHSKKISTILENWLEYLKIRISFSVL